MLSLAMALPPPPRPLPAPVVPQPDLRTELSELGPAVRAVVAAILRRGRLDPEVEDCTHEALRRALEGHERLREGEPVKPWVIGIARHVALDFLRANRRERTRRAGEQDDSEGPRLVEQVVDTAPSADLQLERAQRAQRVRAALASLPGDQRRVLEMFHMEGLAYREIANRLGIPMGTVCTWVARGRKAVKGALEEGGGA
jgi:RNA polymerase sigma-70 factor (ECF subfamily)